MSGGAAEQTGVRSLKLDASGEGCSGMFWRTKPEMNATSNASDWPRNGTVLAGTWETHGGARWARLTNGYFLPEVQKGVKILFDQGPAVHGC